MRTPEVYLSVGRNRRKQNGGNYYLKDGTEFELEIFNPTQDQIGCEIDLDGKQISRSKLVLKPGQRVFLERFLDDNRRFKFSTYEVENSAEAKSAIARNGNVTVRFFKESIPPISIGWTYNPTITYTYTSSLYNMDLGDNISLMGSGSCSSGGIGSDGPSGSNGVYFSSSLSNSNDGDSAGKAFNCSASIETGRTEKGTVSSQGFNSVDVQFELWSFHTHTLRMLPESQIQADEIRQYCPECRCRVRKSSWKWCPQCGEKL